jgi:hypothetical protein
MLVSGSRDTSTMVRPATVTWRLSRADAAQSAAIRAGLRE